LTIGFENDIHRIFTGGQTKGNDIILDSSNFPRFVVTTSDKLQQALDFLAAGDWQRAHAIAQEDESKTGCWIHGIVHVLEGDLDNARYWYRRAGRSLSIDVSVSDELAKLREHLASESDNA
jgi:hypothetical protein